jgi:hypothetical protein
MSVRKNKKQWQVAEVQVSYKPKHDHAKHSNAQVTDEARKALEELFFMYGNAEEIDKSLWQIIVAAISSKDLDHLPGFERANYLCLYKDLSTLIKLLKPNA